MIVSNSNGVDTVLSLTTLIILGIAVVLIILVMTLTSVKWAYRFQHKVDELPPQSEPKNRGEQS